MHLIHPHELEICHFTDYVSLLQLHGVVALFFFFNQSIEHSLSYFVQCVESLRSTRIETFINVMFCDQWNAVRPALANPTLITFHPTSLILNFADFSFSFNWILLAQDLLRYFKFIAFKIKIVADIFSTNEPRKYILWYFSKSVTYLTRDVVVDQVR